MDREVGIILPGVSHSFGTVTSMPGCLPRPNNLLGLMNAGIPISRFSVSFWEREKVQISKRLRASDSDSINGFTPQHHE